MNKCKIVNMVLDNDTHIEGWYYTEKGDPELYFESDCAHNKFVAVYAIPENSKISHSVETVPSEEFRVLVNTAHIEYFWFD